jgi:hypothetical protein
MRSDQRGRLIAREIVANGRQVRQLITGHDANGGGWNRPEMGEPHTNQEPKTRESTYRPLLSAHVSAERLACEHGL